jgi:hypothetical protein
MAVSKNSQKSKAVLLHAMQATRILVMKVLLTHSTLLTRPGCRHLYGLKIFLQAPVSVCDHLYESLYFIQSFIDGSQLHIYQQQKHMT